MKRIFLCLCVSALGLFVFRRKRTVPLRSISDVNDFIDAQLNKREDVTWKDAPADILHSAILHAEKKIVTVGYGQKETFETSEGLQQIKEELLLKLSKTAGEKENDVLIHDYGVINAIDVQISSIAQVQMLKENDHVRYIDPVGYNLFYQPESFGCDKENVKINEKDYTVISPGAWVPWSFDVHNITDAWEHSTGEGIGIGLIDTGISESQELLGNQFNSGDSSGRRVERKGTFDEHDSDQCGHGTSMASAICAPRNDNQMPLGVAYGSSLVAYRATGDVFLDSFEERRGVTEALKQLADRPDIRIISLSIGYMWSIGNIADAIKYAYGKNKLIIAAGGTSSGGTSWYPVIFPANMEETVAVTGVNDRGESCSNCHSGKEIDFTIEMERAEDTSRMFPVLGFNTNERSVNGGSSIATAATAGIAALVWARNVEQSNKQVLAKLKTAGKFYPQKHEYFGYGLLDAYKAVQAQDPEGEGFKS